MGVVVEIPVLANSQGECVRVIIATTVEGDLVTGLDCQTAPDLESRLWRIVEDVPNEDLPETVETPPRPRGACVWYSAAAYENGERVSNYTEPQVIEIPPETGTLGGEIEVTGSGF